MEKIKHKLNFKMISIIMALAWPTMIEQLMHTAVQYIDTAMVGSLGTAATAAVGATTTVNWLIGSTVSAIGVGFLAVIAKAFGEKDGQKAKKAASQAVFTVITVGLIFTAITLLLSGKVPVYMQVDKSIQKLAGAYFFIIYLPMLPRTASIIFGTVLRAAGDTKTPMKIGIIVNIINVVLNFLLIYPSESVYLFGFEIQVFGAGLGVIGAAAASAVSFTVGGILTTSLLWRHPLISPKGESIKPDTKILYPCMKIAFPNMLQRFATSLGYVAFAAMINSLGEISTAAHTIANTVESAFYIPGYGMQTAASTLIGNAYGAKDKKRMKETASMFIPIEIMLMVVSGACLFAVAEKFVGIFSSNPEVIALGSTVLRMVAVSEPFYGFSIILEGMLLGVGNTKEPFLYNVIGMWAVRILGTFICINILGLGLVSAWACMIAHNLLIFIFYLICYIRGKWNPLLDK